MKAEDVKALAEALEKLGYEVRSLRQDVREDCGAYVIEVHLERAASPSPGTRTP